MRCTFCTQPAVLTSPQPQCKQHFLAAFERKVKQSIQKYKLFTKKERLAVGCSGGKDSTSLVYLLKKFGYTVTALAIDEGIAGYRDATLVSLKKFCKEQQIPLRIYAYEQHFGLSLDDALLKIPGTTPCRVCGVWRRYLLNKHAASFDKLVTGHNLDDEAQSIFMNLIKGNTSVSARIGPITGVIKNKKFTPRVKPFYFCTEKEVATYSFLMKFPVDFSECPNAAGRFRAEVRTLLNEFEVQHPGSKQRLIQNFLSRLPELKKHAIKTMRTCERCHAASSKAICNACAFAEKVAC